MQANQYRTWAHLKRQLAVRFSVAMEAQMALSLLSNCKQKPDENIYIFTERVCAEAAYNNQGGDAIDCQH